MIGGVSEIASIEKRVSSSGSYVQASILLRALQMECSNHRYLVWSICFVQGTSSASFGDLLPVSFKKINFTGLVTSNTLIQFKDKSRSLCVHPRNGTRPQRDAASGTHS